MGEFPRDIVGKNIKCLRDYLDLTLDELSNYANISKTSLVNIESGLSNYSTNLLDSVLRFVDYEWHEIIYQDFTIKPALRMRLIAKHPTLNLETRFKKEPSGKKAIEIAVADGHFEKPITRLEIFELLFNKYGWKFSPNSISKALVRSLHLLKRVRKSNERGYQYQKINNGK